MGKLYRDLVRAHSKAKNSYRSVLNALADYADDDGVAWPGAARLANDTGMSERNVFRCLQRLIDDQRISIVEDYPNGGRGNTTHYKIWMPEIGQPAPQNPDKNSAINHDKTLTTLHINHDNFATETLTTLHINHDNFAEPYKEYNRIEPNKEEPQEPRARAAAPDPPPDMAEIWREWDRNMPGMRTPLLTASINELLDRYTVAEFLGAMKIAVAKEKRNLAFIQGILRRGVFDDNHRSKSHGTHHRNVTQSRESANRGDYDPGYDPELQRQFDEHVARRKAEGSAYYNYKPGGV